MHNFNTDIPNHIIKTLNDILGSYFTSLFKDIYVVRREAIMRESSSGLKHPKCFSDSNGTVVNSCRTIYISNDNGHILLINRVICRIVNFFYELVWSNVQKMDF